jgi:hypothetical protein
MLTKEEWAKHLEEQAQSGKSIAAYCREAGISEKSFNYQKQKRRGSFVQVGGSVPIELEFGNGAVVKIPKSLLPEVIKLLLESGHA